MPEHQQTQQSKESKTTFQKQAVPVIQTPISNPMAIIQRARINPKSLTHADIMQLQRTIGNQAVGRLLSSIGSSSTAQQATVQRQEIPEEEEPLQGKMVGIVQRQEIPEEEEPLQGKFENKPEIACPSCFAAPIVQRQEIPEEEKQLQTKRENNTGLPVSLKAGVESLSGIDLSDVRLHYNSSKPAEVGALAYTQGKDIHVAPGQEKHLPHEAWHVVQQAQGRVKPTMQLKDGVPVNDDEGLEHEADLIGERAVSVNQPKASLRFSHDRARPEVILDQNTDHVLQRVLMDSETFDTPEKIKQDQEIKKYLTVYLEIRELVESYNKQPEVETGDVVRCLQLLDLIQEKVYQCRSLISNEASQDTEPCNRRSRHLVELVESIKQERNMLMMTKTEQKDILAGREAVLNLGIKWDLKKDNGWYDATDTLRESLDVTITKEEGNYCFFSFTVKNKKYEGRTAKNSLVSKNKFARADSALLYPNGIPKPEDVQQTNLGDCYLQAALAGLAAQDPAYIMNKMIYDAGERVIIRLYKLPEKQPHFVSVERSKAQTNDGVDLYNAGAMWVKMVQKAYAASGFASNTWRERRYDSITDISGEAVDYVMRVLTGRDLESLNPSGENFQEPVKEQTPLPWSFDVRKLWEYMEDNTTPSWFGERKAYYEYHAALKLLKVIFSNDMGNIRIWAQFADNYQNDLDKFKTLEEFSEFFTHNGLNPGIAAVMMEWVKKSRLYMGKVGSGRYSMGQLMMFDKVYEALFLHKLVTVETKKELTLGPDDRAGSFGEPMYKGLAGHHVYSVLGARKNRTANPDSPEKGDVFWIQLRNPWGEYSRTYDAQWNPVAIEKGNGVFWIELTDLANNFSDVEIA